MAEIVHQEIIDIQVKNGDKNIKNLRKQIKELKDEIANLTLNGKDATNAQKKLTDANKELADAMAQVNKVIVDNISDTDTSTMSYNEMSKELNLLRKAAKDAGDTITRQKYSARIQELDKALKSIDAEMGVFNRNVGNYSEGVEQGTASMRQQIKELRDELTKLSPETEEYANKLVLLAEKQKVLADIQEEAKFASQDYGDRLATITNLGANLASGFAAVQGSMALFGVETENVGKVLVKLQAIMAVVNGLQGLDGLGKNIQGLKRSFAPAIQAVKSFIVGLTGMKAAIAATGIGLLAVGLGTVAANWDKIKDKLNIGKDLSDENKESGKNFFQHITDLMNSTPQFGYNREWADIQKAIFGEKEPTLEDRNLLKIQLYNRGVLDSLKKDFKDLATERGKALSEISSILAKYGVTSDEIANIAAAPSLSWEDKLLKKGITGRDLKKSLKALKEFESYSDDLVKAGNKLADFQSNVFESEFRFNKGRKDEDKVSLIFPWSEEEFSERVSIIQSFYDEEENLKYEHLKRMAALDNNPELQKKEEEQYQEKLKEIRKKKNADAEKDAEKNAEKRNKVYARFQEESIISEYEARRRQYVEEMKLFSNNIAMKKKLTVEYLKDIVELNKKYTKKATEELQKAQQAEFEKRVAGLTQQYIEAAAQPTGDTPTQMAVEQPSAWTQDTVLAYAAETAAAQAFYESEIDYQNTVMQNQITILTNMRNIAREMGNTDAAIEYTRQINVLQDNIAENDTKVANQRVENQKNVEKAEKASNKEGEVTKWTLENVLSMGQSIGKIFGSVASMMDKNSEEGLAAYKAFATASAIIDTLASAVAAYKSLAGIPLAGPALGAAAAAAAVAAGMANVTQIQKTTLGSTASVENSYGSSSVSAPEINAWEPQYTRNIQTDTETEKLNQPIYVTVTDIKKGLDRQTKVVDAAKF